VDKGVEPGLDYFHRATPRASVEHAGENILIKENVNNLAATFPVHYLMEQGIPFTQKKTPP
jgi:hypothetical protein